MKTRGGRTGGGTTRGSSSRGGKSRGGRTIRGSPNRGGKSRGGGNRRHCDDEVEDITDTVMESEVDTVEPTSIFKTHTFSQDSSFSSKLAIFRRISYFI